MAIRKILASIAKASPPTNAAYLARTLPRTISSDNRTPINDALRSVLAGEEIRQPHDDLGELRTEALIARASFNAVILPVLNQLLGSHRVVKGPHKLDRRIGDKIAEKLELDAEFAAIYHTLPDKHHSLVCDYSRSSQLVGQLRFIKRATDMFQEAGVLEIAQEGSAPIRVVIGDVENGFVTPVDHKPKLSRINLKLLIPFRLADGTETFHVLEHKIYLKKSHENEGLGTKAWQAVRSLRKEAGELADAAAKAFPLSLEQGELMKAWIKTKSALAQAETRRAEINQSDAALTPQVMAMRGYKPESRSGKVGTTTWAFTPLRDLPELQASAVCDVSKQEVGKGAHLKLVLA